MITKKTNLFWAPGVQWRITKDGLNIQGYIFTGFQKKMFPEFYYRTCDGITCEELIACFSEFPEKKIKKFVKQLFEWKIILEGIQGVKEIFFHQGRLYEKNNKEKMINKISRESVDDFHIQQMKRERDEINCEKVIKLENEKIPLECFVKRKSIREFSMEKKVSFSCFSQLLAVLKEHKREEKASYYFPSAGGLYPIDYYMYIKENRIEGIEKGLYKYAPIKHQLLLLDKDAVVEKNVHYFTNQEIFRTSALSIFLVYHADASMPKYDGMAYYYAILDAGIITQTLSADAYRHGLGVCSIGDLNYLKAEQILKLHANEKLLHIIEAGVL